MPPDPPRASVGRAGLFLLEILPALAVALILLPWIISTGSFRPWQPAMIDLDVYVAAVRDLLAGRDIYATRTPGWDLPFIYPPVAALLLVPVAFVPLWVVHVLWAVLTVLAQRLVLRRAGVRRSGAVAAANVALVLAFEPFRTTLGYGQVNTVLMALVVADLLPWPRRPGWFPRGALIGLAASIKLTPLAFVVFAFLVGRRAVAAWGLGMFAALTAVGAVVLPGESLVFVRKVLTGNLYGDPLYVGNQSVSAVVVRLGGTAPPVRQVALVAGGLAGLLALSVAVVWWRRSEHVLAVGMVGVATCLASPLSWTHHHVWALLTGLAALSPGLSRVGRALVLAWTGWVALCPVLVFLPYGQGAEAAYTTQQQIVADLGPALAVLLCVWLLGEALLRHRARPSGIRRGWLAPSR